MTPERISAKFFISNPVAVDLTRTIPLFHRWIRENLFDDVLIDVADYKHVPDGPGVLLIGHHGDYSLDLAYGRPGIFYRRKRGWTTETTRERIQTVIYQALLAARQLQSAPELADPWLIDAAEIELTFPDRLNVPPTEAAFSRLQDALTEVAALLYGDGSFTIERVALDERRPLTVNIIASSSPDLEELLGRATPEDVPQSA